MVQTLNYNGLFHISLHRSFTKQTLLIIYLNSDLVGKFLLIWLSIRNRPKPVFLVSFPFGCHPFIQRLPGFQILSTAAGS